MPCYNAARVVRRCITALAEYLDGVGRSWELVAVNDGSRDATAQRLSALQSALGPERLRCLTHPTNCGKGRTVRDGMLAGQSLETLQAEIELPEYSEMPMYDQWLPLNVAGVHRTLVDMSYFDRRPDILAGQGSD